MKTPALAAVACVVALAAASAAGAAAPQAQTAEGAQRFLAIVADGSSVKLFVTAEVTVAMTRTYQSMERPPDRVESKKMYDWIAAEIAAGDTMCSTRVKSRPANVAKDNWHDYAFTSYSPPSDVSYTLVAPADGVLESTVDWGRAVITRGLWATTFDEHRNDAQQHTFDAARKDGVHVTSGKAGFQYQSDDPEMLDRIETAMRFLKASCDQTADTGF
jgi:hypothetical protein